MIVKYRHADLLCSVLGVSLLIGAIILLVNTSWVGGGILLVTGLLSAFLPILESLRMIRAKKIAQRSAEKEDLNEKTRLLNSDYVLSDEELQRIDDWWRRFAITRQESYQTDIKLVELNRRQQKQIQFMEFSGDYDKRVCMVCKLDLRSKQKTLECPICLSLFHYDHLVSWLKKVQTCPVCGQQILQQ
ncbi:MAG: hypothetical protein ACTSQK_12660 [Candidatus Heimdallarchaeota archaeon]